ncbi:AAA family ATPase [Frigidibacter albus]
MTHATTDSSRPTWWAHAQQAIRRLQQEETENPPRGTMKLGGARRGFGFDDDLPAQLGASADVPPPSPLALLSAVPDLRHLPPDDWDAIAEAGGDPAATTERGATSPAVQVPWRKLLLTVQLAASVGSAERLHAMLARGAVTLLTGVAEDDLKIAGQMLAHLIPADWLLDFEGGNDLTEQSLSVIKPRLMDGKISTAAARDFLADVVRGLQSSEPVLIVQTTNATLPADLPIDRIQRITLVPVTGDVLVATLSASHSATGRIDESRVRATLPDDRALAGVGPISLALAMRGATAREVAERLSCSVGVPKSSAGAAPRLDQFTGDGKALRAARQLVRDLALWRAGTIGWHDLSRSLLVYGPPGTGKTWLARAIGNDANLSVVTGSFAEWQAKGHLGDMLRAMRESFAESRKQKPAVLIIDEIDAAGSRQDADRHNHNYRVQVINGFLAELDSLSREEGVIVVGTCNHPEMLDPAILRAGRFDLKIEMPLPDAEALYGVFRRHLAFPESEPARPGTAGSG